MGSRVLLLGLLAVACGAADGPAKQAQVTAPPEAGDEGPPTSYSETELRSHVDVATAFASEICACKTDACLRSAMNTYRPTLRRIRQPGNEQLAQQRQFERARVCLRLQELDERERETPLLIKFLREL